MLKKPAIIMLMILYLGTVSGFVLNLHYCFNQLSSVKIDAPVKDCTNGRETGKMKCCKDKHFEVKVKDAHQTGSFSFGGKTFAVDLPKIFSENPVPSVQEVLIDKASYRGPPVAHAIPIFLQNRNFRI
ncbi:MAG: HYC_CC_PP family protein [Mucilaginibacter sp.]